MQRLLINIGMAALVATTIAACSSSTPTEETKSDSSKSDAKTELVKTDSGAAKKDDGKQKESDHKHDGTEGHAHGETVEVDGYNLELSQHKEGKVTHLDLSLKRGEKREPVTDAKVTAQIQLPDGSSKRLDLAYKPDKKVYAADITDFSAGSYKVAVLSDVSGKKVNARFNLKL